MSPKGRWGQVRVPFSFTTRGTTDYRFDEQLRQLNQALAANGDLRRRVASLELENTELRRQAELRRLGGKIQQ